METATAEASVPEFVIRLPARLDPSIVPWVKAQLALAPPGAAPVLDFGHVLECPAWALAALVSWVGAVMGARFRLRGLTQHQERLLRYVRVGRAVLGPENTASLPFSW